MADPKQHVPESWNPELDSFEELSYPSSKLNWYSETVLMMQVETSPMNDPILADLVLLINEKNEVIKCGNLKKKFSIKRIKIFYFSSEKMTFKGKYLKKKIKIQLRFYVQLWPYWDHFLGFWNKVISLLSVRQIYVSFFFSNSQFNVKNRFLKKTMRKVDI